MRASIVFDVPCCRRLAPSRRFPYNGLGQDHTAPRAGKGNQCGVHTHPLVVLIDSESDKRFLISRQIRRRFPHVALRAYADSNEGMRAALDRNVELLITNGRIGTEDGLALIAEVHTQKPALPIMLITLWPALEEKAKKSGVTYFFDESAESEIYEAMTEVLTNRNACG